MEELKILISLYKKYAGYDYMDGTTPEYPNLKTNNKYLKSWYKTNKNFYGLPTIYKTYCKEGAK